MKAQTGTLFRLDDRARDAIKKILPFTSTGRAEARLEGNRRRCYGEALSHAPAIAGDVGSGKKSWYSKLLIAIENGCGNSPDGAHGKSWRNSITSFRADFESAGYQHRAADRLR
jgi:hypothetical protein